jgi:thioredoxin-related protein
MKKNLIVAGLIAIAGSTIAQGFASRSNTNLNENKRVNVSVENGLETAKNTAIPTTSGVNNFAERNTLVSPQEAGPTWYSFEEGYAKAVSEGKILLVDAYTVWCGWCKVLDRKTYADPAIIAKLSESFICVKFNPELSTVYNFRDKKWSGTELLQFLGNGTVNGFPTTIFWPNPASDNDRYIQPGYLPPNDFSNLLDMAKGKKS